MKQKIATFDIETNKWIYFLILGFFDGEKYITFDSVKKFILYLNKRKYRGYWIYAHNGGKFDFLFLLEELKKVGYVEIIERQGRIIILKFKSNETNFCFVDSYALLSSSLKKLSDSFQPEHKKLDFEFEENKILKVDNKKMLKYLHNDVLCLYEIIEKFSDSEFVEKLQFTIASQALNTFKEKFFEGDLQKTSFKREDIFRNNFYSGGRVEVFKGEGKIHYYDVNSLYPFAMLNEMPTGECFFTQTFKQNLIGFYEIELLSSPDFYVSPFLKKSMKNYYVNGKGKYHLDSETLIYLKKEFGIRYKILQGYYFKKKEQIFFDYVQTFYKIKSEATTPALKYIAKLMLNSLYGKFGQTRIKEKLVSWRGQKNITDYCETDETLNNFGYVLISEVSKNRFILPYLAAYITSLARLYHFKLIQIAEQDIFYCDTDSILSSNSIYDKLVGSEIGQLNKVGIFQGVFLGNKSYALRDKNGEEKITFRGFDSDSFSYRDLEKALKNNKELKEERKRLLSYRECMKRKMGIIDSAGTYLKRVSVTKINNNSYDKRKVIQSDKYFFDTIPFNFKEV